MATFPVAAKPIRDELPNQRVRELDSIDPREIVHDLMNQLTVIDLSVFQLRSCLHPVALTALERAVESALRSAERLRAEINSSTANPQRAKPRIITSPARLAERDNAD